MKTLSLAKALVPALVLALGSEALAQSKNQPKASAADLFLNSVGGAPVQAEKPQTPTAASAIVLDTDQPVKLIDPFVTQLYQIYQLEPGLSYEVRGWFLKICQQRYTDAAHLWGAMLNQMPAKLTNVSRAGFLYTLWKLQLKNTFVSEWIKAQAVPGFKSDRFSYALDEIVSKGFDQWLVENPYDVNPQELSILSAGGTDQMGPIAMSLYASSFLRKGTAALPILEKLTAKHAFKLELGKTVSLALAKKGDLAGAGRVLKLHVEPALEARNDPMDLANHYLQVGRLLYQANVLDGALAFYEKVPEKSPDYPRAKEEVTWLLLRQGNHERLRGHLETLSAKFYKDRFAPEVPLVRAVANLKFCYYDKVEDDFKNFLEVNSTWAKKIDQAVKSTDPVQPREMDRFSKRADQILKAATEEKARVEKLAQESIGATLPAVGPQKHWVDISNALNGRVFDANKNRLAEYRRQWGNDRIVLNEAIRKMQFVKVETLTQVRALATQGGAPTDSISTSQAKSVSVDNAEIAFQFDGVIWPDELFRLRSNAQSKCLNMIKK
ncbi:MAG: hypothetical protein JNL01_14545 [Bdellovibrionales bacterium]|nr:hypothetical protein [Bdellovibrionales bacterium]